MARPLENRKKVERKPEGAQRNKMEHQRLRRCQRFSQGFGNHESKNCRKEKSFYRKDFRHVVYFVAGIQAEKASWNSIAVFKVSNISGKGSELVPTKSAEGDPDIDAESSDSEDSEDEKGGSGTPILRLRNVGHYGCGNSIRSMTQNPHICASLVDSGHVQGFDYNSQHWRIGCDRGERTTLNKKTDDEE